MRHPGVPVRLLLALLLVLVAQPLLAAVTLDATRLPLQLGRELSYLQDAGNRLGIAEVAAPAFAGRFTPVTQQVANFGYSDATVWLRTELHNRSSNDDWLLALQYSQLDCVDFYLLDRHGRLLHQAAGDSRPFALRPVRHRHFVFRFQLPPGESATLYLQARSAGTLLLPLAITTPQLLQEADHRDQLLAGIYAGTLLAMLVYNLLLYLSLRERGYLYYVLYIASFGVVQATFYGIGSEYLWPERHLNNIALPLGMGVTAVFLGLFSLRFLQLRQQWPAAARVIDAFVWLFAILGAASFFTAYGPIIRSSIVASLIAPLALLAISGRLWWRGYRPARYFLIAFAVLLLGFLANGLTMLNLAPDNLLTGYGMPVGSMLEITLLSFALAHRLKLAQEDNQRLQQAHAAELEQRVGERTLALHQALRDLTHSNEQLYRLTMQDALTGLYNRKYFDEYLQALWRTAQREQQPLALLMLDIDHFKQVNDRYGHPAGDAALRCVAGTIAACVHRPGDAAVRYGGEEFAVLLPHTDDAGTRHMGEAIRSKIAALQFCCDGQPIPLSVSVGATWITPAAGQSADILLGSADALLYRAKHQGRNRVVSGAAMADTPLA